MEIAQQDPILDEAPTKPTREELDEAVRWILRAAVRYDPESAGQSKVLDADKELLSMIVTAWREHRQARIAQPKKGHQIRRENLRFLSLHRQLETLFRWVRESRTFLDVDAQRKLRNAPWRADRGHGALCWRLPGGPLSAPAIAATVLGFDIGAHRPALSSLIGQDMWPHGRRGLTDKCITKLIVFAFAMHGIVLTEPQVLSVRARHDEVCASTWNEWAVAERGPEQAARALMGAFRESAPTLPSPAQMKIVRAAAAKAAEHGLSYDDWMWVALDKTWDVDPTRLEKYAQRIVHPDPTPAQRAMDRLRKDPALITADVAVRALIEAAGDLPLPGNPYRAHDEETPGDHGSNPAPGESNRG